MKASAVERRIGTRVPIDISVNISCGETWIKTVTCNISTSGFYCRLKDKLALNTKIAITLLLPDTENGLKEFIMLDCTGIVVRAQKLLANSEGEHYKTAIFFTDLKEKDTLLLKNYLNKHTLQI